MDPKTLVTTSSLSGTNVGSMGVTISPTLVLLIDFIAGRVTFPGLPDSDPEDLPVVFEEPNSTEFEPLRPRLLAFIERPSLEQEAACITGSISLGVWLFTCCCWCCQPRQPKVKGTIVRLPRV